MKKHFRRLQKAFFGHAQGREMNREKIRSEFQSYVRHYDPSDPKIRLKIDHTYRVADLCERIAGSLSLFSGFTLFWTRSRWTMQSLGQKFFLGKSN